MALPPRRPLIIGVRHFSPACARLVVQRIGALRPRHVLIEGPADFNDRLAGLALPHRLPLAIYSYFSVPGEASSRRASWSPFALHAPEWQATLAARAVGARLRFIDLPAWHEAFAATLNRYADANDAEHEARAVAYEAALCQALSIDSGDALWDHLFEGELALDELASRLDTYFAHLRADDPGSPGNQAREAMMARHIAWAMAQDDGPVVVVCGGYHAPALAALWAAVPVAECRAEPPVPLPCDAQGQPLDGAAIRFGSYLVPYHFKRLDALTGYASGMSSPAWYAWLWKFGSAGAGAALLKAVLARLRQKNLAASTADFIAIHANAMGLARLRSHQWPLRSDWLDALAGSLVKQALDAPLPWTYRGPIRAGTDAALVQVMDVLAGDAVGQLAPGTPQPPLVSAVEAELAALGLALPSTPALNLLEPAQRRRSCALHRLALLGIPGFTRTSGPGLALGAGQQESWSLSEPLEQRAALIEAAVYGATLHDAASARIEEILRAFPPGGSRLGSIADGLSRAAFAGLSGLSARLLGDLHEAVGQEAHFHDMGRPMDILYALYRHGDAVGMKGSAVLQSVLCAAFDRALWLAEAPGAVMAHEQEAHIGTYRALAALVRDALADGRAGALADLEPQRALAVCRRKAGNLAAPPLSRGAALGLLLSLDCEPDAALLANTLLASLPPARIGDALAGLLALARQHLSEDARFVGAVDTLVRGLDDADFVLALPAMRGAFAWLATHERGDLAAAVLELHGASQRSRRSLTGQLGKHAPQEVAANEVRERAAIARLAGWGIAL
ncbi:hypothetical protein AAKU55_004287 [Oxalobacteraceae bacterium GrIS 1.11]